MSLPRTDCSLFEHVYHDTFVRFPCVFDAALEAADVILNDASLEGLKAGYPDILCLLCRNADLNKVGFSERSRITEIFRLAQLQFSLIDSIAPRSEDSLTGSLQSRLSSAAIQTDKRWRNTFQQSRPLHLWTVELIMKGREQALGGDIAFVFEADGRLGATCLQAKRLLNKQYRADGMFSIAQPRSSKAEAKDPDRDKPDWQLKKLSKLNDDNNGDSFPLNPGYLFYDNPECGTPHPVLPLVKAVASFEADEIEHLKVDLCKRTSDLASFVVDLMTNAETRSYDASSMRALANRLVLSEWQQIVCVTSTADFRLNFSKALEDVQSSHVEVIVCPFPIFEMLARPEPAEFDIDMSTSLKPKGSRI